MPSSGFGLHKMSFKIKRSDQAVVGRQKRPGSEQCSAVDHHSTGQSRLLNPGSFLRSQYVLLLTHVSSFDFL